MMAYVLYLGVAKKVFLASPDHIWESKAAHRNYLLLNDFVCKVHSQRSLKYFQGIEGSERV